MRPNPIYLCLLTAAIIGLTAPAMAQNSTIYARDVPAARDKQEEPAPDRNTVKRTKEGKSQYNSPQGSLKSLHTQEPGSGGATTMDPDVEASVDADIESTTGTNPADRMGSGGVDLSVGGGGMR